MGLEHDFVKVLDFGLVKRSQSDPLETRLTAEMVTTGTPAYVSPEGALGRELDARADLYSLGCVGYWLLTGKLVFEGATSMEMLVHHAKSAPSPPSQRTEIPIPAALDAAILWCLEKDPDQRPGSAAQLAERLGGIAVAEPWTPERARHWWEAHQPGHVVPAAAAPASSAPPKRVMAHAGGRSRL
jgi:serine/threonine-protein kinase